MSRQLNRIRSLISDIDEIQKQGQTGGSASQAHSTQAAAQLQPVASSAQAFNPAPSPHLVAVPAAEPELPVEAAPETGTVLEVEIESPAELRAKTEKVDVGHISLNLTGNVVVQLQMAQSNEIVEVRHIQNGSRAFIEIRFSDGKAVHLPLKAMA